MKKLILAVFAITLFISVYSNEGVSKKPLVFDKVLIENVKDEELEFEPWMFESETWDVKSDSSKNESCVKNVQIGK